MALNKTPLRLVMVDDDPEDIFLTKYVCNRASVEIDFTGLNSAEALFEFIDNNGTESIDLILLDVFMPADDGYDVRRKLQSYKGIGDVTIVMFSSLERSHDSHASLAHGESEFIKKPSTEKEMSRFIDYLTLYHRHYQGS